MGFDLSDCLRANSSNSEHKAAIAANCLQAEIIQLTAVNKALDHLDRQTIGVVCDK